MLRYISYGAGTQSSVMMLLAARGEITPMPDFAVWADTGDEPTAVHDMVRWMVDQVPFPLIGIGALRSIRDGYTTGMNPRGSFVGPMLPTFTVNPDGTHGMSHRLCTDHWKLRPILTVVRNQLGVASGRPVPRSAHVEQWIGISRDEVQRMRTSKERWRSNRYPLVDLEMSRLDCEVWWLVNAPADAPPLPRSACVMCPYHSDAEWRRLSSTEPEMVTAAAEAEAASQQVLERNGRGDTRRYLHRRRIPLLDALAADRAQFDAQPSMFDMECEGICGV